MMKDLHHSCQGESHLIINKVCQDASYSDTTDSMSIAIVCDGHGGERYFRSDIGAKFAIEVTKNCVESFIKEVDVNIFKGKSFTQKQAIASEAKANVLTKDTLADKVLRQLFSSIIYNWRESISTHSQNAPLSDDEKNKVDSRYQDEFLNGIGIEKTYGCTLMCYVYTSEYWLAFHIGDGKCVTFDRQGLWNEPIPWDDRCFLNKTTSLCDSDSLDEFRYCYCGNGHFPLAVFLGSDGIDDSFGTTENMVNFYIQTLKLLANEGKEKAIEAVKESLPELSKIGSKDDMSIACVYDEEMLSACVKDFIEWQRKYVGDKIAKANECILKQKDTIAILESNGLNCQKSMVDYQYAHRSLERAFAEKRTLANKWNHFSQELLGDNYSPYEDEIGFGELVNGIENNIQETEE